MTLQKGEEGAVPVQYRRMKYGEVRCYGSSKRRKEVNKKASKSVCNLAKKDRK